MRGKIASAGQNGQFRTPRHIIPLMVEMVEPKSTDCCLWARLRNLRLLGELEGIPCASGIPKVLTNAKLREHFHHKLMPRKTGEVFAPRHQLADSCC
jgi:type I restriction enzyme M protein